MPEAASEGSRRPAGRARTRSRRTTKSVKVQPRKPSSNGSRRPPSGAHEVDRGNSNRWLELILSVVQTPLEIAQSQTELLVTQLEKTGSLGQREAERLLSELRGAREKAQGRAEQEAGRFDRFVEGKIEDVLNRINIPSRSDIERLNNSVDVLTAKVEALVSRQERGGSR